jgi:multidrug resistance efflux pump
MVFTRSAIVLGLSLAAPPAPPQPAAPAPSEPAASASATLDLTGTLIPAEATAIALWPERYREELLVLEVVPHGSFVNQGDVLIRFDTDKIDDQIRQEEFELEQAKQKLARSEDEGRIQQEASRDELTRAEREAEWAARRLQGYMEKEKGFQQESIRLNEQTQQNWIADQRDELEQLEKMYREDELVDATEEIVLKRSRRDLGASTARAALSHQQNEYTLSVPEAIKQQGLELDAAQKRAALERQQRSAALAQASREDGVVRAIFDLAKQQANLDELKRDRQLLAVRAPRGGLLLHGEPEAAPGAGILERGSRPGLFKTIMTVADPDKLLVIVDVPEASLGSARSGTAAKITVAAAPRFETVGRLEVEALPASRGGDGQNLYRGKVAIDAREPRLRPGMRCKVSVAAEQPAVSAAPPGPAVREVR